MSRIDTVKNRLGDMFLRDRLNIDEKTAELMKSDIQSVLSRYFRLTAFSAELKPHDDGVSITVTAEGKR